MPEPRSAQELAMALRALEREISARRDITAHEIGQRGDKRGKGRGERADLNPIRHYAIAITDLEAVRLRVLEAARLERQANEGKLA